jgi:hypothetical protein
MDKCEISISESRGGRRCGKIGAVTRIPLALSEILSIVDDRASVPDLQEYYAPGREPGHLPDYTGARFDSLAGGGDRPGTRDRITVDDLVAVQLLSVLVPRLVSLDLLEGALGERVTKELEKIPTNVDLGSPPALPLLDGPADRAWRHLEHPRHMGWVTAGKLLARKRPRLVPVYDGVVRCALGRPRKTWQYLQERFAEQNGVLAQRLVEIRSEAGVAKAVPPPRVLDVIIWMRHRRSHQESRCPGINTCERP